MFNSSLNYSSRVHRKFVVSPCFELSERVINDNGSVSTRVFDPSKTEFPLRSVLATHVVVNSNIPLQSVNPIVVGEPCNLDGMINYINNSVSHDNNTSTEVVDNDNVIVEPNK